MSELRHRFRWRFISVYLLFLALLFLLLGRLSYLTVWDRAFLLKQNQARVLRVVSIPAYRGMVQDRNGKPLAISVPAVSVWVNPQTFAPSPSQLKHLASLLSLPESWINSRLQKKRKTGSEFLYLKRRIASDVVQKIKELNSHGLYFQHEYRRFYPEGEVSAHVVGLTNVDNQGQEGLELGYNQWLSGSPGSKRVIKDRLGHVIAEVGLLKQPIQGRDLVLSLDRRIQFLAYSVLSDTVEQYHAKAGSVVVLDPRTGEIIAMANVPAYDPNGGLGLHDERYRNRAVTDMFEPGSTIKPFNVALALESGQYTKETPINANPGWMRIGGYTIRDEHNNGVINLTELLRKSSNIGAAKVMLSLEPKAYWRLLRGMGFGQRSASGFPGEASGVLTDRDIWQPSVIASMAYGYGMSVTTLQLAQAYAVLANQGKHAPITFLRQNTPPQATTIISPNIAKQLCGMLEAVVNKGGTGERAHLAGYRVAGKTGTAYTASLRGYDKTRYVSSFVGFAPVSHPALVIAVVIFEPQGRHFGAQVAAPAFARILSGTLRLLNISPDALLREKNESV